MAADSKSRGAAAVSRVAVVVVSVPGVVVSRAAVVAVSVLVAVVVVASRAVAAAVAVSVLVVAVVAAAVSVLVAAAVSPSSSLMILSRAGQELPGSSLFSREQFESAKRRAQRKYPRRRALCPVRSHVEFALCRGGFHPADSSEE